MSMIDYVTTATTKYIEQMPKAQRKKYGQFFTSKETAVFMAELFDLQSVLGPVSILDPGAGSGILSTALIERMQRVASITKIELVCYESDTNILELLRSNLDWVCDHATKKIKYKIISDNYILSQVADYNHMLWESPNPPKFDCIAATDHSWSITSLCVSVFSLSDSLYSTAFIVVSISSSISMLSSEDSEASSASSISNKTVVTSPSISVTSSSDVTSFSVISYKP